MVSVLGSVKVGNNFFSLQTCVFSKGSWDDFESLTESLNGILVKISLSLTEFLDLGGKMDFSSTSSWEDSWVSDAGLNVVDTIINDSLEIVEHGGGGTSEDESGDFVLFFGSLDNSALGGGDFGAFNRVGKTDFIRGWGTKLNEELGSNRLGNSLELKLGHDLQKHNLVLFEEMDSKFRDGALAENDSDSSLGDSLNEGLHLLLFSLGVGHEILGVLDENGTLGISLLHFDWGVVYGNLGISNGGD